MRSGVFARYWAAATVSSFGTSVTAVAMPVLLVQTLQASPTEVGLVNAAQFVPCAVLGLIAGVENSNEMGYWQALTPIRCSAG